MWKKRDKVGNKTGCKKKILFKVQFFPKNWLTAKHGKGLKKMNICSILFFSGHFIIRRSLYKFSQNFVPLLHKSAFQYYWTW